jgi:hypothetical protein
MRIVARRATDACIFAVVAFAIRQPVGLKADVGNTENPAARDVIPRPMTLSAKIRQLLGGGQFEPHHVGQFAIALPYAL